MCTYIFQSISKLIKYPNISFIYTKKTKRYLCPIEKIYILELKDWEPNQRYTPKFCTP